MKVLKITGIVLGALIALVLIIGMIQPTHFAYERSTSINAPKEVVFNNLNNLKNREKWGPWAQQDPTMVVTYEEKTEGLGASYSWVGNPKITGAGTMTISESTSPSFLKTDLDIKEQGKAEGYFKIEDSEGGSAKTSWGMSFDMPYPINAMTLFTGASMEKGMNEMFDLGLSNLKTLSESEGATAAPAGLEVKAIDFPGKAFLGIRDKVKINPKTMQEFFAKSYGAIDAAIGAKKLAIDGHPSGIYFEWDEKAGTTDMAAAMPVKNGAAAASGNIKFIEISATKGLRIDYYGGYASIGNAHTAMDAFMKKNGLKQRSPVIEEYITDPGSEPDSSKWLTKVYYFFEM